ncbi:hypothetical protein ACLB1G_19515 [Oxalobacteraceae bacterium A2-2]
MNSPDASRLTRQSPPAAKPHWPGIAAVGAVLLAAGWGVAHQLAQSGSEVSLLWGLAHYRKAGDAAPPAASPAASAGPVLAAEPEGAVRAMSLSATRSGFRNTSECSAAYNGAMARAFPGTRIRAKEQVLWIHTGRYSAVASCADYNAAVLVVAGPDARQAEDMHAAVLAQLGVR